MQCYQSHQSAADFSLSISSPVAVAPAWTFWSFIYCLYLANTENVLWVLMCSGLFSCKLFFCQQEVSWEMKSQFLIEKKTFHLLNLLKCSKRDCKSSWGGSGGRCAAFSGAVIWFYQCWNDKGQISTAGLNAVSPRFSGETLDMRLCSIPPPASLILPGFFHVSFPLSLSFADFASVSFQSFCSRFFCFLLVTSVYVYLSRCLCFVTLQSVRVDISGTLRQVVRHGFTRLCERWKVSGGGQFTSTS